MLPESLILKCDESRSEVPGNFCDLRKTPLLIIRNPCTKQLALPVKENCAVRIAEEWIRQRKTNPPEQRHANRTGSDKPSDRSSV
jgi:hypothetical protein